MANTRSNSQKSNEKQATLDVKKSSQGEAKVTAKRKQEDEGKDVEGKDDGDDDKEPPAKAAKQESDDAKGAEKKDEKAAPTSNGEAAEASKADKKEGDASSTSKAPPAADDASNEVKPSEKKAEGKDSGPAGPGQEEVKWEVLERGHIYFFYRPKVKPAPSSDDAAAQPSTSNPSATSINDAQNFHMLLLPRSSSSSTAPAKPSSQQPSDVDNKSEQTGEKAKQGGVGARLIRLGKKRMPEPREAIERGDQPGGIGGDSAETIWSVISDVSPSFTNLKDSLSSRRYTTKTSGERLVGGARPAGRGWYVLTLSHTDPPSSREVRLSYVLSHPSTDSDFGEVQKEFGLAHRESSVTLSMRNPTLPSTGAGAPPAGLEPSERVQMSDKEVEETFGGEADGSGTRYARPENVELLDRAGVELLMIKRKEQEAEGNLGMGETHKGALEKLAGEDAERMAGGDVLRELGLEEGENPPDALDGEWI